MTREEAYQELETARAEYKNASAIAAAAAWDWDLTDEEWSAYNEAVFAARRRLNIAMDRAGEFALLDELR